MQMTEKIISLDGQRQQMIDINGDLRAFHCSIDIVPQEQDMDKEYEVAILTQTQIDSGSNIPFSRIRGRYKKTFQHMPVSDQLDVYYIILTSSQPIENMKLLTDIKEMYVPTQSSQQPSQPQTHPPEPPKQTNYLKYIIAIVILVIGCYFLYMFFTKNGTAPSVDSGEQLHKSSPIALSKPVFSFY